MLGSVVSLLQSRVLAPPCCCIADEWIRSQQTGDASRELNREVGGRIASYEMYDMCLNHSLDILRGRSVCLYPFTTSPPFGCRTCPAM
jgi:hypothetical protein